MTTMQCFQSDHMLPAEGLVPAGCSMGVHGSASVLQHHREQMGPLEVHSAKHQGSTDMPLVPATSRAVLA